MKNALIVLLLIVTVSSCNMAKRCAALFPPRTDTVTVITSDTVEKEVVTFRDIPVYFPGDSVTIHDTIPFIDTFVIYHSSISGKHVSAEVDIRKGKLTVNCKTDSLMKVIAHLSDTLRTLEINSTKNTKVNSTVHIPVVKKVPYIPWPFWIAFIGTILYWGWKLYPSITKLIAHWKT